MVRPSQKFIMHTIVFVFIWAMTVIKALDGGNRSHLKAPWTATGPVGRAYPKAKCTQQGSSSCLTGKALKNRSSSDLPEVPEQVRGV